MDNNEFDRLLYEFSQAPNEDTETTRVPIVLELLKDKNKRLIQVLAFIRSYVPRKQERRKDEEFKNMLAMYFMAKEFEDKIELRNFLVAFITSSNNPRQYITDLLDAVRYYKKDTHVVDAIAVLSRLKTDPNTLRRNTW